MRARPSSGSRPRPSAARTCTSFAESTRCKPGLILGHEPVGVIEELGDGLEEHYQVGQRVIVGAITPCGQCFYCLNGAHSQCGGPLGGWRFGNTINGAWAEYLLVPDARANLAPIPDGLTDETVLLMSRTSSPPGCRGAESGNIKVGDAVAVFAQGPIGLCATLGARLRGAALIIGVDPIPSGSRWRGGSARRVLIDASDGDPIAEIKRLTEGRGVDVAIEALGQQETFENALRRRGPAARCRASASTPESSSRRTRRSTRAGRSEDRHDALSRAARNGCAD